MFCVIFFFCTDKKEHTLNDETSDTFMSTCTNGMRVKCAHLTTKDIRIHNRHTERHKSFEFNVKLTDDIFDLLKTSVGVCLCSRCIQVFNVFALADFVFIFFLNIIHKGIDMCTGIKFICCLRCTVERKHNTIPSEEEKNCVDAKAAVKKSETKSKIR